MPPLMPPAAITPPRPDIHAAFPCDFHFHSDRSDGRCAPADLLAAAAAARLHAIALTDHDLPPALPAGDHVVPISGTLPAARIVRVIHGAEVSVAHEDRELHILVWFSGEMPAEWQDFLRERARWRAWRYDTALAALGLPDRADADACAGRRSLTRHHLAHLLVQKKLSRTLPESYLILRPVVPKLDLRSADLIRRAREAGAITAWAHPPPADAQRFLPALAAAGLQGLEIDRPLLAPTVRSTLRALASRYRLISTGGSDWHGWREGAFGAFTPAREYTAPLMERLQPGAPA